MIPRGKTVYPRYAGFPLSPFLFNFYAAEMINVQKSRSSVDPAVIMLPARVNLLAIKRILKIASDAAQLRTTYIFPISARIDEMTVYLTDFATREEVYSLAHAMMAHSDIGTNHFFVS